MRLWHQDLINKLSREHLLGQHRECCALRGNGWGRKHSTVDYVFSYSPYLLYIYHVLVMNEIENRGYKVSIEWLDKKYRGKNCESYEDLQEIEVSFPIYKEHDNDYYSSCVENLERKNKLFIK